MLHADRRRYEQTVHSLSRPTGPEPDCWLSVHGVFRSHGGFDHELSGTVPNLHVIRAGFGVCEIDGRRFELGPGDCVVFHPGRRVRYHDDPRRPWRYDWFMLEGVRSAALLAAAGVGPESPWRPAAELLPVADRVRALLASGGDPLVSLRAAWLLLDGLLAVGTGLASGVAGDDALARSARRLIDSRFMNPITIAGLARELGVSRSTLFRRFRERYHQAPQAYLVERRLERACQLLADTGLSVAAVAAACGFAQTEAFARVFRRHLGRSPSAWRAAPG